MEKGGKREILASHVPEASPAPEALVALVAPRSLQYSRERPKTPLPLR